MLKVKATKPKIKPFIEISDDKFLSTSSTCFTYSSLSSLCLFRKDKDIKEVDKPSLAYKELKKKKLLLIIF